MSFVITSCLSFPKQHVLGFENDPEALKRCTTTTYVEQSQGIRKGKKQYKRWINKVFDICSLQNTYFYLFQNSLLKTLLESRTSHSFNFVKMISREVLSTIDKLEKNMIRDYVVSTDFKSIVRGVVNEKRRLLVIIVNILLFVFLIRFATGFLAPTKSNLHFYVLNPFYGYGYLGKLWNGMYICGFGATILHSIVFLRNEAKGTLDPIIKLREMYANLDNPSPQESATFLSFLKIGVYVREIGLITIWIPMVIFRGVGAALTAYKWNSLTFLLVSIPDVMLFMILQLYPCQIHAFTHLLIAQSTTYFQLRLSRVEKSLGSVVISMRSETAKSQWRETKINMIRAINEQLFDLKQILNEVNNHNECIKYWLRDELIINGGLLCYFLVSMLAGIEWYYKISTVVTIISWSGAIIPSFVSSAQLYIKILSMAKLLYSCQNDLTIGSKSVPQGKSTSILYNNDVSRSVIIKTKHQVMRMIHRVSSPYLRIGYTEGNGESFSPASIGRFASTIAFGSLMFLNSRSSAVKDLLSF